MSATAEKLAYDDADGVLTAMRRGAAPVHMRGVDAVEVRGERVEWVRHEAGSLVVTLGGAAGVRLEERGSSTVAVVGAAEG